MYTHICIHVRVCIIYVDDSLLRLWPRKKFVCENVNEDRGNLLTTLLYEYTHTSHTSNAYENMDREHVDTTVSYSCTRVNF